LTATINDITLQRRQLWI